jgi:hypothetical protein
MIVQFVQGLDLEAFREDPKTVAAVERKLLLISEAATRLGEDAERLCPGLPWHNYPRPRQLAPPSLRQSGCRNSMEHGHRRSSTAQVWGLPRADAASQQSPGGGSGLK